MITLALYRQMLADQVAGLTANQDFWWEEAPLQQNGAPAEGVWLVTRGGDMSGTRKGLNLRNTVDFYVAFANKAKTEYVHTQILQYLKTHLGFCELSGEVGEDYTYQYYNVRVRQVATPENAGATENGVIVKMASAEIIYDLSEV